MYVLYVYLLEGVDCKLMHECTPHGGRAAAGEVIMNHQGFDWRKDGGVSVSQTRIHTEGGWDHRMGSNQICNCVKQKRSAALLRALRQRARGSRSRRSSPEVACRRV